MKDLVPAKREPSVETMQRFHNQLFQMINARLTDTFRFYAPLLAALPAFGYVVLGVLREDIKITEFPSLLDLAYSFSMLLLLVGAYYLFTVSYTYRSFQLVLCGLEEKLGLTDLTPHWDIYSKLNNEVKDGPKKLRRFLSFWIIPEILKPHLWMFVVAACFVFGAQYAVLNEVYYLIPLRDFKISLLITLAFMIVFLAVIFRVNWYYLRGIYNLLPKVNRGNN